MESPAAKKRRLSHDWSPNNNSQPQQALEKDFPQQHETFVINLGEGFESAKLPKICTRIMDNEIFQRLHDIHQTGVVYHVFPDMTTSRFAHSVGTASIAYKLLLKLNARYKNRFTGSEMLCVVIAALCHDLGHGPYSHLCESLFKQKDGIKFTHEEMSLLLFDKMLKDFPKVKEELGKYFEKRHYELIKKLINPPSFPKPGQPWDSKMFLVPACKAFLYAIVNNKVNGFDVDKLNYLYLDSKRAGVPEFAKSHIAKFISFASICWTPDRQYSFLGFKDLSPLRAICSARCKLHSIVYSHRNCLVFNEMYLKMLELAGPHLMINHNGVSLPMNQCFDKEHLDHFLCLTDVGIKALIKNSPSTHQDMVAAKKIIRDVDRRKFFVKGILTFERLTKHYDFLESAAIREALKECKLSFNLQQLYTDRKDFHSGQGLSENPLNKVLLISCYDRRVGEYNHEEMPVYAESVVHVYAPPECNEDDFLKIFEVLSKLAKDNGIREPRKKFKRLQNELPDLDEWY